MAVETTRFFQLCLGRRLKYSSGFWAGPVTTLDQAEEAMLKLTCQRARLENGQHILDLGCGWGSLSLWMAEQYPAATITGIVQGHLKQLSPHYAEKPLKTN